MCYCTGSLGVRADNDLPAIARSLRLAHRVRPFARHQARGRPRTFHEAAHLEGDVDMVAVLRELIAEDRKRGPGQSIVFRPDHGQKMIGDFGRKSAARLSGDRPPRGLAELRGIMTAIDTLLPA